MASTDNAVSAAYVEGGAGISALETLEETARYNRWICSHLRPHLSAHAAAINLELGAGVGTLTALLGESHRILPVENSPANLAALQRRFRGSARVLPPLADYFSHTEPQSLDCIYSSNVLEHIFDDLAVIRHAAALLKPGGRFVAFVPAGMWLYSPFDAHIGHHRRYTVRDRERIEAFLLRERLPLEFTEFRFLNPLGALGWFVNMRLRKRMLIRRRDALTLDWLTPSLRLLDPVPLPFGQSALMVLRRV